MTDGERWTAGVALVGVVTFLAFGLQQPVKDNSIQFGLRRPVGSLVTPSEALPQPVSVVSVVLQPDPIVAPADVPVTVGQVPSSPVVPPVALVPPPTAPRPRVVALVRPTEASTSVDDGRIAATFLPGVGVPVKVLTIDPARTTLCADTLAAGNVVVAGQGLAQDLRSCLLAGGATVLSYDGAGSSGRSVSTRVRASLALIQAAGQADRSTPVGLAVSPDFAGEAKVAQTALQRQGRKVEVAVVPPGATSTPDYLTAIQAFSAAGVSAVVFGMPQADQSTWASLEIGALFQPVHIVADIADAFLSEGYLATFDGAIGVATTRVPWFERDHKATASQAACRARYEKATGTTDASSAQLADVYVWCQHAQILRSGLDRGEDLLTALRSLAVDSPMTSPLKDSPAGYGPSQEAVLSWGATCSCWTEKTPFKAMP